MGGQPSKRISMSMQPDGEGNTVQVTEDFMDDLINQRPEFQVHANKLKLATEVYQEDLQGRLQRQEEIFREYLNNREEEREERQSVALKGYVEDVQLRFRSEVSEPHCQAKAEDVQRCLASNQGRPLDCNTLVDDFLACSQSAYQAYRQTEDPN